MPYNLLTERWIPVRRRSGAEDRIAPHEIADAGDPPVALAAPRPDFDGALAQLLVGLVQTTMAPEDDDAWAERWLDPPSPDDLAAAFAPVAHAFDLDGEGSRFFQDLDPLDEGKVEPASNLLLDTTPDTAVEENRDHFIKDRGVDVLSLPAAAMALLTMQTNAPSGGRGHYTSLRDAGPLTTLILGRTLWETAWLNSLPSPHFASPGRESPPDIFPWLAPTRIGSKEEITTPDDVNKLQVFWGMPRRIRLTVSDGGGTCAVNGEAVERAVTTFRSRPNGVNYKGSWEHPLSPHYRSGSGEPMSVHGQPARIAYRNWLGYVYAPRDEGKPGGTTYIPAAVIRQFHRRAALYGMDPAFRWLREGDGPRLWAFGLDFPPKEKRVRAWQEGLFPLFGSDADTQHLVQVEARRLVEAASAVAFQLKLALKNALFGSPEVGARGRVSWDFPHHIQQDSGLFQRSLFAAVETEFWAASEPAFFATLDALRHAPDERERRVELRKSWLAALQREALTLFDRDAQTEDRTRNEPQALVLARRDLERLPFRPDLKSALGLDAPTPQPADA